MFLSAEYIKRVVNEKGQTSLALVKLMVREPVQFIAQANNPTNNN